MAAAQVTNVAGWEMGPASGSQPAASPGGSADSGSEVRRSGPDAASPAIRRGQAQAAQARRPPRGQSPSSNPNAPKKGFFRRLLNVFK